MKDTLALKGQEYFAIIYTEDKHMPEQGHGYPAYNYKENVYKEIGDKAALEKWIIENHTANYGRIHEYKVVLCKPVEVEVAVTIKPTILPR